MSDITIFKYLASLIVMLLHTHYIHIALACQYSFVFSKKYLYVSQKKRQSFYTLPLCMQKVIADITQTFHLGEKQVAQNGNLLVVLEQGDNDFVIQLYGCAVVLFFLVLTASVLMITSSLNSNVARQTEFFGMLRCVGVVLSVELQWVF